MLDNLFWHEYKCISYGLVMAGSFLKRRVDVLPLLPRYEDSRLMQSQENDKWLRILMPFLLIIFAFCVAPESPNQLASICQRHNSEIACQVW